MTNLTTKTTTRSIFTKIFSNTDSESVLTAVKSAGGINKVVFIDLPSTNSLVELIKSLKEDGIKCTIRDHHNSERDAQNVETLKSLCTEDSVFTTREKHKSCANLVKIGEFADNNNFVVADKDMDGILSSLKAQGVYYSDLESDAELFDTRGNIENASELGKIFKKAMSTLPPFNRDKPWIAAKALQSIVSEMKQTINGDPQAKNLLLEKVVTFETKIANTNKLKKEIKVLSDTVSFVDISAIKNINSFELIKEMENLGAVITVTKNSFGSIAKIFGTQYTIGVKKGSEINLKNLLPKDYESSPEDGLICNAGFKLHCNEEIFQKIKSNLLTLS